jgi:regulator of replication initiation timing
LLLLLPFVPLAIGYRLQVEYQAELQQLRVENQHLRDNLAQQTMNLQLGSATERQLTQRNAALLAQIERLTTELAFFRRQNQKP